MSEIKNIREFGNQLAVIFDDGSKKLAYPTGAGVWVVGGTSETPPGDSTNFVWPFPLTEVTSEYGQRDGRLHAGLDFGRGASNQHGSAVKAAGAGKVVLANNTESHGGYGNAVVIDHGGGRHTLYAHLSDVSVSEGQQVATGHRVGGIGQTGASQGNHLHFETHEDGYRWNASARDPRLMLPKWNAQ